MRGPLWLLKSLIESLPRHSSLRNAIVPGQGEWGVAEYLMLGMLRVLEFQNRVLFTGLPVEGELPPPWPVHVPGEVKEESKPRSRLKELATWLMASQRG